MADSPLLVIETDFVRVEVRGPFTHPRVEALGIGSATPPHFAVDAGRAVASVEFRDEAGVPQSWSPSRGGGPRFYEATRYQLIAVSKDPAAAPTVMHRDASLVRDVVPIPGQPAVVWTFDFKEQVGLSTLTVAVGTRTLRLTIEVFPTKLDYATDYRDLLQEVGSAVRGLAFEYLRSTYARASSESTDEQSGIEWLSLVRHHVAALEAALLFIETHSHRILRHSVELTRTERVRKVDSATRSSIAKGKGAGEWIDDPSVGKVRAGIRAGRAVETADTPEHRWIKHNLRTVRNRLAAIADALAQEAAQIAAAGRKPSPRLTSEREEVSEFRDRIERLSRLSVLQESGQDPPTPGFASLTLLSAPGYADAYQRLLALRLGLHVHGDMLDLSTKELDVLYETWCFIRLAQIVVKLAGCRARVDDLLEVNASGIRVRLQRGQQSNVFVGGAATGRELVVSYNRHFAGLTGAQMPDIILEFRHDGWPEIVVVFDAKYRVDASPSYLKSFAVAGPPTDAVDALHRYRDAIVVGTLHSPRGRPVVKGVALFPLPADLADDFKARQPLYEALSVLGIGALPFLPDSTSFVEEWLASLLKLPPEELASPGPPWLAQSHRDRLRTP